MLRFICKKGKFIWIKKKREN